MTTQRKPKSPYRRYNKSPYVYSDALQNWRRAVKSNNAPQATHWLAEWNKRFRLRAIEQQQAA